MTTCAHKLSFITSNQSCTQNSQLCNEGCDRNSHSGHHQKFDQKQFATNMRLKSEKFANVADPLIQKAKKILDKKIENLQNSFREFKDKIKNACQDIGSSDNIQKLFQIVQNERFSLLTCSDVCKLKNFQPIQPNAQMDKIYQQFQRSLTELDSTKIVSEQKMKDIQRKWAQHFELQLNKKKEEDEKRIKDLVEKNNKSSRQIQSLLSKIKKYQAQISKHTQGVKNILKQNQKHKDNDKPEKSIALTSHSDSTNKFQHGKITISEMSSEKQRLLIKEKNLPNTIPQKSKQSGEDLNAKPKEKDNISLIKKFQIFQKGKDFEKQKQTPIHTPPQPQKSMGNFSPHHISSHLLKTPFPVDKKNETLKNEQNEVNKFLGLQQMLKNKNKYFIPKKEDLGTKKQKVEENRETNQLQERPSKLFMTFGPKAAESLDQLGEPLRGQKTQFLVKQNSERQNQVMVEEYSPVELNFTQVNDLGFTDEQQSTPHFKESPKEQLNQSEGDEGGFQFKKFSKF